LFNSSQMAQTKTVLVIREYGLSLTRFVLMSLEQSILCDLECNDDVQRSSKS